MCKTLKKCPNCNKFRMMYYGKYVAREHWICSCCGYNTVNLNPKKVLKLLENKRLEKQDRF